MRITKIRFKNINSLKGHHEIDFTSKPLKNAGIFAITGATGSGKSTILDVMSLALYNSVPRLGGKISTNYITKTGSIVTRNTKEAYAEVDYSCAKGDFTSKWSISSTRTNKFREYEMELAETNGKILDVKRSEVPSKNEELIGLSYNQFIRSILLAQGEFAKFLNSKKEERTKLLEKITGTEIYAAIGKKAFEKYKEHGERLEFVKVQKAEILTKIISEDEQHVINERLIAIEKLQHELTTSAKELAIALELKTELLTLNKKINTANSAVHNAQVDLNNFNERNGLKLSKYESLLPIEVQLRAWQDLQLLASKLSKSSQQFKLKIAQVENERETNENAIERLLMIDVGDDTDVNELLNSFLEKVQNLQAEIREAGTVFNGKLALAKANSTGLGIEFGKTVNTSLITSFESLNTNVEAELEQLTENLPVNLLSNLEASLSNTNQQLNALNTIISESAVIANRDLQLSNLKEDIEQIQKEMHALPQQIRETQLKFDKAELELKSLVQEEELRNWRAKYEEDRSKLIEGEACPLCGSENHPFIEHYKVIPDQFKKDIAKKKIEQNEFQRLVIIHTSQLEQLQKNNSKLVNQQSQLNQKNSEERARIKSLSQSLSPAHIENPKNAQQQLITQKENLETIQTLRLQHNKLSTLIPQLEELLRLLKAGSQLRGQLNQLYAGDNVQEDVERLKKDWNRLSIEYKHQFTLYSNAKAQLEDTEKQIQDLGIDLRPELNKLKFESIEQALPYLILPAEYQQLSTQKNTSIQRLENHQKELAIYKEQLQAKQQYDHELSIDELLGQKENLDLQLENLKIERDELLFKRNTQYELLKNLKAYDNEIKQEMKENEKWLLLKDYIGDASGKRFSTFAQQLTLKQLILLANQRLKSLSERYVLDISNEDTEDNSLVVNDKDMGGQRRSVKTLSGGESFLISLSLALGLSDLASKNVEINSLFIDEGFGSLDPLTLDQTLDTLERLQSESNKTIGVISHVEALKERISTQIEVVMNGQGFSTLYVH